MGKDNDSLTAKAVEAVGENVKDAGLYVGKQAVQAAWGLTKFAFGTTARLIKGIGTSAAEAAVDQVEKGAAGLVNTAGKGIAGAFNMASGAVGSVATYTFDAGGSLLKNSADFVVDKVDDAGSKISNFVYNTADNSVSALAHGAVDKGARLANFVDRKSEDLVVGTANAAGDLAKGAVAKVGDMVTRDEPNNQSMSLEQQEYALLTDMLNEAGHYAGTPSGEMHGDLKNAIDEYAQEAGLQQGDNLMASLYKDLGDQASQFNNRIENIQNAHNSDGPDNNAPQVATTAPAVSTVAPA